MVNGGTYAPGLNGLATQTVSSLSLTNNGLISLALGSTGYDQIKVNNSLSINNGQLHLNLANYSYTYGTVYTIVDYTGAQFDPNNANNWFTINDQGTNNGVVFANYTSLTLDGGSGSNYWFHISYDGIANGQQITLTAVPEPGTASLLGLIGVAWLVRRIRRRRGARG